ncbi:class III signal peptide-containing protein [Candidatus Micrarchaeota archaeon]|nr:class III signal peptide-containing protein [Candidatus Micrarchaeota archaeon]
MKKGQGAFEYILLLAGVLLIVVIIVVLLRGPLAQTGPAQAMKQACYTQLASSSGCWDTSGNFKADGVVDYASVPSCKGLNGYRIKGDTTAGLCTATSTSYEWATTGTGFCGFCLTCCGK